MTVRALLDELRRRGVGVRVDGDELVLSDPGEVLNPKVLEAVRRVKAALVGLIVEETEVARIADLAERVGMMQQYFHRHAEEWSLPEYRRRRDVMLYRTSELEGSLTARGQRLEDYGWAVTDAGDWYRTSEPPPVRESRYPYAEAVVDVADPPPDEVDEADEAAPALPL